MGNAYLKRMPAGFAGDVSRKTEATIESGLMAGDVAFGSPVKLDTSGKLAPVAAAADVVYGFMVRPYPTQDQLATSGSIQDCMRRGYMTVRLASGTAAKGGKVYVRIAAADGKAVGDIEAAAVKDETAEVTGCIFLGAADDGGIVEIAFNI